MSWLRLAVSKAVEVGNQNNLPRTVRNYTDSIVQHAGQAVAEGAKRFQDQMGGWSSRSVKKSIQRWEEAAVSCRGPERLEILRRWALLLKEVERQKLSQGSVEEKENVPKRPVAADDMNEIRKRISLVLYYDSVVGGEPMNFCKVFLQSQALEGITLSMALPHMRLVCEVHGSLRWWIQKLFFATRSSSEYLTRNGETRTMPLMFFRCRSMSLILIFPLYQLILF